MAEIEEKERTTKDWLKIILPRVLRAAFWGFIMGGELLFLLYGSETGGRFADFLPLKQTDFSYFLFIFIGFEVAIQLLRGTVIQYALGIARAFLSMIFLVLITNGGVMNFAIQSSAEVPLPPGVSILFTVDFKAILAVFLLLSLVSAAKNLLQAIEFLSEKAEEPVVPPELP